MTLDEVLKAIDELTPAELRQVREYLEEKEAQASLIETLSPEERWQRLDAAFEEIRAGFTEEELAQITHDMNAEYIEPVDEEEWRD